MRSIVSFTCAAVFVATSVCAGEQSKLRDATQSVQNELWRYWRDAKDLALTPVRWNAAQWTRFGEGAGAVAAVYVADAHLYRDVQQHRSSFTNHFAKTITPFGARRALDISALMVIGGAWRRDTTMLDAGRDSLEGELWAAGVVTPLLKRAFGRARPIQEEGAHSFHPLSDTHESFPSGHATNAFAFATGIASHYDNWVIPTIVYSVATGVALSRVNDRQHFSSDVVAGALIGRAVAKSVVARHHNTQLSFVPGLIGRRPAVLIEITR